MSRNSYKKWRALLLTGILVSAAVGGTVTTITATAATTAVAAAETEQAQERGVVASKEEVIYALLTADGTVSEAYAVNILNVSRAGIITDAGEYEVVKNLTNTSLLTAHDGAIEVSADEGRFYYQGEMKNTDLPWDIQITYTLDGNKVTPEQLGGAAGHLKMQIRTSQNEKVQSSFYDYYMLQVSVALDPASDRNIAAEGATFANSGSDKLLTFTVMPGTDGDITVEADVEDFEMAGIAFTAVPFSADSFGFDLDSIDEMTAGIESLAEAIELLHDGVGKLGEGSGALSDGISEVASGTALLTDGIKAVYSGAAELSGGAQQVADGTAGLSSGAAELSDGSQRFSQGLNELSSNSSELVSGSIQIYSALQYISQTLTGESGDLDLSALAKLPAGLRELAAGLDELEAGLGKLSAGYEGIYDTMNAVITGIPEPEGKVTEAALTGLYTAAGGDPALRDALDELSGNYTAAQTVKATWSYLDASFQSLNDSLAGFPESVTAISAGLKSMASQTEAAIENMDVMDAVGQLTAGVNELTKSYGQFHSGLRAYTGGVDELAAGYKELDEGISALASGTLELAGGAAQVADGTGTLADGIGALAAGSGTLASGALELASGTAALAEGVTELQDGTKELHEATKDMPEAIDEAIDELMGSFDTSDFEPVSFTSKENENVTEVQFVIQTAAIEKAAEVSEAESEEQKETIWTRFLDLFSL